MIIISGIITFRFYDSYKSSQINILKNEASLVIKGVEDEGVSYLEDLEFSNHRITLINNDGVVLFDTDHDYSTMENHLEREEVKDALLNGYGESERYSDTILETSFYVAYKIDNGDILRLSYTTNSVLYIVLTTVYPIFYVLAGAVIISIVLSYVISKKIVDPLKKLDLNNPEYTKNIEPILIRFSLNLLCWKSQTL